MTEGYAKIAELLTLTYTSTDDVVRNRAEQDLSQLASDSKYMIEVLLRLAAENVQVELRMASATKLRHLLRTLMEGSALSPQEKCEISEAIFQVMTLNISKPLRTILNFSLSTLLSEDKLGMVSVKLALLCTGRLKGTITEVQASLMAIKSLFSNISADFSTKDLFFQLIPQLTSIGLSAFSQFLEANQNSNSEALINYLQVLCAWAETLSQILEHLEMISPKALKSFLDLVEISTLFGEIICFKPQNLRIFLLDLTSPNIEMSQLKTNILKCMNVLMQFTLDSKKQLLEKQEKIKTITTLIGMDLPDSPFVNVLTNIIEPIMLNLLQVSNEADLAGLANETSSSFIIESLELCVKCCGESRFTPLFSQYFRLLLLRTIPNTLHLTESDKDQVESNPNEFVDLGMDICERQESETVKTTGAKLLEMICDNIDGALTCMVNLACSLLEATLNGSGLGEGMEYFSEMDQETRIDLCVIMLCTVSYSISRRKDLIGMLDLLFSKYFEALTRANSAIVQSRLSLFLYFYAEHLHTKYENQLASWVWFTISCMASDYPHKAATIQACETLSSICQDEEVMLRIHTYIPEVFNRLVQCLLCQREKNFFEALLELMNWYTEISNNEIIGLVRILIEKVRIELTSNFKDSPILIQKCWNIIRNITNSEFLNSDKIAEFEEILLPLALVLKMPTKQAYEDDIIVVLVGIMRKTKRVSGVLWQIFEALPFLQQKQGNSLQGVLKLLNYYIFYDAGHFQEHSDHLYLLVSMASEALYSTKSGKIKESLNSEGALLFQLILQSLPGYLDTSLEKILTLVVRRYTDPPVQNHFLKVRLLEVLLTSFSYNFALTCNILLKDLNNSGVPFLRFIMIELIQNRMFFKHPYDKKVAVLGLSQIFIQNSLPSDISELGNHLFEALISIISLRVHEVSEPQGRLNKLLDKLLDHDMDDLTDSEIMVKGTKLMFGDHGSGESTEETEASLTVTQLISPMSSFDEIAYFKEVLSGLNTRNPTAIKATISALNADRQQELIEIVMSQRVKLADFPGENTVVRKIVKAKHR